MRAAFISNARGFITKLKNLNRASLIFLVVAAIISVLTAGILYQRSVLAVALLSAEPLTVSPVYYGNLPANDPFVLTFRWRLPPGLAWNYLVDTEQGIPVRSEFDWKKNTLAVYPRNGQWPRSSPITVRLKRPESIIFDAISLLKQIVKPGNKGIFREFSFVTAGQFTIIGSSMTLSEIDIHQGIELRFNYRLKDPDTLADFLDIDPGIPLTVTSGKTASDREKGMVFLVTSPDFTYKSIYALTVKPGLISELEDTFTEPYRLTIRTKPNPNDPHIVFGEKYKTVRLFVANPGHPRAVPIEVQNTTTFRVSLYETKPADVINYLIYKQETEENYWDRKSDYLLPVNGKKAVWQKDVKVSDISGGFTPPDLPTGVYVMEAVATDTTEEVRAATVLNITSMGAVSNIGKYDLLFWSTQVDTGEPVDGAEVRVYSLKNGATIKATGTTDKDGLSRIVNPGEGDIAVIFGNRDAAFIPLAIPGSTMASSGTPTGYDSWYYSPKLPSPDETLKTYIYTDRPIYKAGDTINAKAIIRNDRDGVYSVPGITRYSLILTREEYYWDQQEQPLLEIPVSGNEFGTIWSDIKLPEELKSGAYYVILKKGDKRLASQGVLISEYRKPMYHLEVETSKPVINRGDTMTFDITATYAFGAPVKDKNVTWKLYTDYYWDENTSDEYAENNWERDGYSYWWYGNDYHNKQVANGTITVNAIGEGTVEIPVTNILFDNETRWKLTFVAEITDESSVPENASAKVSYSPSSYRLEVLSENRRKENAYITAKIYDDQNKGVSGVPVSLSGGKDMQSKDTSSDGTVTFPVHDVNDNQITLMWKDSQNREEKRKYHFYFSNYVTDESSSNDILRIKKKSATVTVPQAPVLGDTSTITVKGGGRKHLVVFERASAVDAAVIGEGEQMPFVVDDTFMPNVYVSTYSFTDGIFVTGYASIKPETLRDWRRINVSVRPDRNKYNPGDTATLEITTIAPDGTPVPSEVSLAVVDKAIFDLKKKSEFPIHPYYYHLRPDETRYSENLTGIIVYDWGGGGGGGGGDQVRDVFADTAYYRPDIITDSLGKATVTFTLPDNLTTWVMSALAVSTRTDVGDYTGEFSVNKDIFAIPVFPSALTEGDTAGFGSLIGNFSILNQNLSVSFAFDNIAPQDEPTKNIQLSSNSTEFLLWSMPIRSGLGNKNSVVLVTTGINERADAIQLPIPVNRKGTTIETRTSGIGGGSYTPQLSEGTDTALSRIYLYLTGGILGYISDLLSYQAGYPYGCVEQTMSKFYPTLQVKKYLSQLDLDPEKLPKDLDKMIEAGIARLRKFQHNDGGWGLWESDTSSVFNTSYVLTGLYDLSSSYAVPNDLTRRGVAFLEQQAAKGTLSASEKSASILPLARFGSPGAASIAATITSFSSMDDQELAQTVVALAAIKDGKTGNAADELIRRAQQVQPTEVKWDTGKNYNYHPHENLTIALAIQALLAVYPDHEYIPKAINYLNNHRNANVYGSTYTNSQVTKAFIEYARKQGSGSPDLTIKVKQGGRDLGIYNITKSDQLIGPVTVAPGSEVRVEPSGNGTLLWEFRVHHAFTGDVRSRETGKYAISRSYKNLSRTEGDIRVGDIVQVTLTVNNRSSAELVNPVIRDPVPGGFQVIDTELENENYETRKTSRQWLAKELHPDRTIFFPDRVNAGSSQTITYLTRAFIPGSFAANPADVSGMYDSSEPAYTSTETIRILPN